MICFSSLSSLSPVDTCELGIRTPITNGPLGRLSGCSTGHLHSQSSHRTGSGYFRRTRSKSRDTAQTISSLVMWYVRQRFHTRMIEQGSQLNCHAKVTRWPWPYTGSPSIPETAADGIQDSLLSPHIESTVFPPCVAWSWNIVCTTG